MLPIYLCSQSIIKSVNDLIVSGYSSYSVVRLEDKARLTDLLMRELGKDAYEAVLDYNFSNLFSTDAVLLAHELKNCAIEYCAPTFEKLFQELFNEHHAERMRENGFHAYTDKNTGETRWVR